MVKESPTILYSKLLIISSIILYSVIFIGLSLITSPLDLGFIITAILTIGTGMIFRALITLLSFVLWIGIMILILSIVVPIYVIWVALKAYIVSKTGKKDLFDI